MRSRRFGSTRSTRAPWRTAPMIALVIALLLTLAAPPSTGAEEPGEEVAYPLQPVQYLTPISDRLGGAAWAMTQGYDPRLWIRRPEGKVVADELMLAGAGGGATRVTGLPQQVPFRNPAPAFSRNLIVTRPVGLVPISTEPHIVVNPLDPEHLVLGAIDYNVGGLAAYVSFDGGETWDGPRQVRYFREDFGSAGDPVLAFDRDGNVYYVSISIGVEEFNIGGLVSFALVSSMVVSRSTDGGLTWSDAVSAARSVITTVSRIDTTGRERGTVTLQFLDKPWIGIGPSPTDPDQDVIYVSYTEFSTTYSLIYADELPFLTAPATETTIKVVHSTDGGATWSEPVAASPTVLAVEGGEGRESGEGAAAAQADDGGGVQTQQPPVTGETEAERTVQGSQPKVLSDGTLVVAYLDTTNDGIQEGLATIDVAFSRDGGKTFSPPQTAGVFREAHFLPRNASFRYWGAAFPQVAIGPSDEIYIVTTALPPDKPADDGDIYLMRSFDAGQTWEAPVRVNQDDTQRLQFFPAIAVDPEGVLHIMWGDMRDDPHEVRYHIYYTQSEDRGETFGFTLPDQDFTAPDTRVSDFPSNSLRAFPGGRFIGDYFAITATEDDVYLVWADSRLGEFGGFAQQIGFARRTQLQAPTLFLNPPSGSAGRIVDIQGFGFQADSNILLLVSGVIVANPRTDEQGRFQTSIYMPVTGEGPTSVSAFDETGNRATASFFTEFGFDNLQRSLEAINQQLAIETPVPEPVATPAASGAAPLTVSSVSAVPLSGSLGLGGLAVGAVAYGGLLWRRRRR